MPPEQPQSPPPDADDPTDDPITTDQLLRMIADLAERVSALETFNRSR